MVLLVVMCSVDCGISFGLSVCNSMSSNCGDKYKLVKRTYQPRMPCPPIRTQPWFTSAAMNIFLLTTWTWCTTPLMHGSFAAHTKC